MSTTTTYLRMLGYVLTIAMHGGNMVYMNMAMKPEALKDPQLKAFGRLQPRYFTVWTFFLQVIHAIVGLACDWLMLSNSKKKAYRLPKHLKGFKDTLFNAVLWPSTWIVFSVFWPLYIYDRRLIYPEFIDKVLTITSNHIMHTAIIFVVLWEACFRPRIEPRSHKRNLFYMTFHLLLYFAVITYTYMERGIWLYPIFDVFYNTVYFPLIHITIALMAYTFYKAQWTLNRYIWSDFVKSKTYTIKLG